MSRIDEQYRALVADDELTCESCPTQWEGQLRDGRYFYFRYRFGHATLAVGATAGEVAGRRSVVMPIGDNLAGTMDQDEYRATFLDLYESYRTDR